jgi:hypothetical protein
MQDQIGAPYFILAFGFSFGFISCPFFPVLRILITKPRELEGLESHYQTRTRGVHDETAGNGFLFLFSFFPFLVRWEASFLFNSVIHRYRFVAIVSSILCLVNRSL